MTKTQVANAIKLAIWIIDAANQAGFEYGQSDAMATTKEHLKGALKALKAGI